MGGEFAPYSPTALPVGEVPGVTSLQCWGEYLFAGRADGTLTVLKGAADAGNPAASMVWKPHTVQRLGQQQILQLAVAPERRLLFCLTEDGVSLYSLPQLRMKGQASRTKGSTCFAWDEATNSLAVAIKRRVLIFTYDGLEFVKSREVSAAEEPIVDVQLLGATVFICTKREATAVVAGGAVVKLGHLGDVAGGFTALPGRRVLFTLGKQSSILDENAKPVPQEPKLIWAAAPAAVGLSGRHVAAVLVGGGLEIQLLSPRSGLKMSQHLDFPAAERPCVCSSDAGEVYASAAGRVSCWRPAAPSKQAEQLLALGALEEALDLCSAESSVPPAVEARVKLAYGRKLCLEGKYEDGMFYLGSTMRTSAAVGEVLSVARFLLPESLASAALGPATAAPQVPEPDRPKIASILAPYLLSYRTRQIDDDEAVGAAPLRVLIDTALLRAFLLMPDNGALLQFVQRPNHADLDSAAAALAAAGRYVELVALYKMHGKHVAALDTLEKLTNRPSELAVPPAGAAAELTGLTGAWSTLKYLETHEPRDFSLISLHAKWLLGMDPDATIDMLVRLYSSGVQPSAVLPILSSFKSELAASYLEKVVEAGASEREFHQDLALLLLNNKSPESYAKLRSLILTSNYLDCEALLRLLPPKGLWEVRAALLERLERHLECIRIYVHHLNSLEDAEAYCDRVVGRLRPTGKGPFAAPGAPVVATADVIPGQESVYHILVRVLQEEEDRAHPGTFRLSTCAPDDARWKDIASLLSRKRDVVDALAALALLPEQLPLVTCAQFLEAAVRAKSEERRKASVATNLFRARHIGALVDATNAENRCIMLTQERSCSLCHKRLGVAAFVRLPGGPLAHYSCFKRNVTRQDST